MCFLTSSAVFCHGLFFSFYHLEKRFSAAHKHDDTLGRVGRVSSSDATAARTFQRRALGLPPSVKTGPLLGSRRVKLTAGSSLTFSNVFYGWQDKEWKKSKSAEAGEVDFF